MQREHVRDMPVTRIGLVVIVGPLLNLAMLANRRRGNSLPGRRDRVPEIGVDARISLARMTCVNSPLMIW